jgi:hypothetical protein
MRPNTLDSFFQGAFGSFGSLKGAKIYSEIQTRDNAD